MRFGIASLGFSTLLFCGYGIAPNVQRHEPVNKITEAEIKSFINSHAGVDECESLDQIHVDHLEYFDFTGDGQREAIAVASTCMTGTAGPDIHAVYARDAEGRVVELPFLDAKGDPPFSDAIPVFGNPNYGLAVENGKLVARWRDSSDREAPVVAWYKWDGKKFVLDQIKVDGPFATSYDCGKAKKELDRAICYSPSVAALDVQLGQAYRSALQQFPPDKKLELQGQQREWLARREKQCTVYKWWVECLTDLYTKRIAELKQR
ncbi:MAG TPA: lysozyme inhibitor LprI family protein [Candidatus Acidoferrum sp.]|nr:lysozyme inhibitor LprI family protein [Candidatus Acidoferrum sp.]